MQRPSLFLILYRLVLATSTAQVPTYPNKNFRPKSAPEIYFSEPFTSPQMAIMAGNGIGDVAREEEHRLIQASIAVLWREVNDPVSPIPEGHYNAPASHAIKNGDWQIHITAYKRTETEFDCEGTMFCTLESGIPYFSHFRVHSTARVPAVDNYDLDMPASVSNSHFKKFTPLNGWIEWAKDPIAYRTPTNLPPLEPNTEPDDYPAYTRLVRNRSDAILRYGLKAEPYIDSFWLFSNISEVSDAEDAIRNLQVINEALDKMTAGKDYPANIAPRSTYPDKNADKFLDGALKLMTLARREFGKWRSVKCGATPGGLGDTGNGWVFENPAAAGEYNIIRAKMKGEETGKGQ